MAVTKKKKPKYSMLGWSQISPAARRVTPKPTPVTRATGSRGVINPTTVRHVGIVAALDPNSPEGIQAQAEADANAAIAAKAAEINRTRAEAEAKAQADEAAIRGFSQAGQKLMGGIPAEIAGIRNEAGSAIAGYGEGYSKAAQADIEQGQAKTAQTTSEMGQAAAPEIDAAAAQRALYAQEGGIPATEQSQIGAASGNAAAGMPAVLQRAAEEDVMQRMAEAAVADKNYAQQLLDLNAEKPGLVQDAVDRYNKIKQQDFENALAMREQLVRERAETVSEMSLNARTAADIRSYKARLKSIDAQLQSTNERIRHDQVSEGIAQQNADTASQNADTKAASATGTSAKDKQKNYTNAAKAAPKLRGTAILNPQFGKPGFQTQGKYIGRQGAKGLLPSGTTNDPNRAARKGGMTWINAQTYLVNTFKLTRAQARQILFSIGWRPGK